MSRRYVDGLLGHREVSFVTRGCGPAPGLFSYLAVQKGQRPDASRSTYTLARKATPECSVTSLSARPLYVIFVLGVLIFSLASLAALGLAGARLFATDMAAGWPTVMVSLWFIGGLIIFCQGMIGIYLAQVYVEVKRRPIAVIRQLYDIREGSKREQLERAG